MLKAQFKMHSEIQYNNRHKKVIFIQEILGTEKI